MSRTVLLTGATGFLAKHVLLELLARGHAVVGTLRSAARRDEVEAALRAHLPDPRALARLRLLELDLMHDEGWDAAMHGVDAVVHTASPCPLAEPENADEVVRPAVEGTRRVMAAAYRGGVRRIVVTSSLDAMIHHAGPEATTESHWSDLAAPAMGAYARSKTLAEQAAWDFAAKHPDLRLTVLNPGLLLGAPLDRHYGSSVGLVRRLYIGRDPLVPDLKMPVVDVADVARAHVAALERPASAGRRYVCADKVLSLLDVARLVKQACPARPVPTRRAPTWLVRVLALFDSEIRRSVPLLGRALRIDSSRARAELGIDFAPAEQAVLAAARRVAALEANPAR